MKSSKNHNQTLLFIFLLIFIFSILLAASYYIYNIFSYKKTFDVQDYDVFYNINNGQTIGSLSNFPDFNKVKINFPGEISIEPHDNDEPIIDIKVIEKTNNSDDKLKNILKQSFIGVVNNELVLNYTSNQTFITYQELPNLEIVIRTNKLDSIILEGSSKLENKNELSTDKFNIILSGSGKVNLENIEVKKLDVKLSGSGDIRLFGKTDQINIDISGSGDVDAKAIKILDSDISISGSGSVKLGEVKSLKLSISGSGDLYYDKADKMNINVTGSGEIIQNKIIEPVIIPNEKDKARNYCSENSRIDGACLQVFEPVCGYFNNSIQCLVAPCAQNYSNSCMACQDEKVSYWQNGECN